MSGAAFELYADRAGEWRWRPVHGKGNVIADSDEDYATEQKVRQGIRSVEGNTPNGEVETTDG